MISKDKIYRTRDGREVRIYATDGRGVYPVHGAVQTQDGWSCCAWDKNGSRLLSDYADDFDLIEVKPRHKRTVWLNMYTDAVHGPYLSRYDANEWAVSNQYGNKTRIACLKVDLDFEEGEGLTQGTYTVSIGGSPSFDNGGGFTPSVNKVIKEGL